MIANLMMYARPELEDAHKNFWRLIRQNLADHGIDSPENLAQDANEFHVWRHPNLVLSQTCGMPYRTWLCDDVQLVGTPDYGLLDCDPGRYRSALVVRLDDPRTAFDEFKVSTFAYNQVFSQSGYAAPYYHTTSHCDWFPNRIQSDGHVQSAKFVAQNSADIASIDAMTWRLIQKYEPFCENLRVLEWTEQTPGLPLITSKTSDADTIFHAVELAIQHLAQHDRDLLSLRGLVRIPKAEYLKIPNPPNMPPEPSAE